jgi:hypothetical protein
MGIKKEMMLKLASAIRKSKALLSVHLSGNLQINAKEMQEFNLKLSTESHAIPPDPTFNLNF